MSGTASGTTIRHYNSFVEVHHRVRTDAAKRWWSAGRGGRRSPTPGAPARLTHCTVRLSRHGSVASPQLLRSRSAAAAVAMALQKWCAAEMVRARLSSGPADCPAAAASVDVHLVGDGRRGGPPVVARYLSYPSSSERMAGRSDQLAPSGPASCPSRCHSSCDMQRPEPLPPLSLSRRLVGVCHADRP